jgi:hypothetical protein
VISRSSGVEVGDAIGSSGRRMVKLVRHEIKRRGVREKGVFQGCKFIFEEKDKLVNSISMNSSSLNSTTSFVKHPLRRFVYLFL